LFDVAVGGKPTYRCAVQVSEEEATGFWNYAISHLSEIEFGVTLKFALYTGS
jgi:hypothetical protein